MKKGFILALLTVALVFAYTSDVSAEAPLIGPVGDVFISNDQPATPGATGANPFVFPDAIDLLDLFISDDTQTADGIKWSFTGGAGDILLNGVGPLDAGLAGINADDPTSPRAANRVDLNDLDSALDPQDASPFTVTFRDASVSPIGGPEGTPPASPVERMITLFASDCSTFVSREILVTTIDGSSDSVTGGGAQGTVVKSSDFSAGADGWTGAALFGLPGTTGMSLAGLTGLCLTGQTADNASVWISPEGLFDIVASAVYRVTLSLSTDQTTVDAIPFFDVVWDNFVTATGFISFGGNHFIVDGAGGAAGIGRTPGISTLTTWIGPNASGSTQFDAAVGDAGNAGALGIRAQFRMLDLNASLVASADSGTICMANIEFTCFQIPDLTKTLVFGPAIDPSTHAASIQSFGDAASTASVSAGSASIDLTPQTGTSVDGGLFQPEDAAVTPDSVNGVRNTLKFDPAVWEANTTYCVEITIKMTSSEADPPDIFTTVIDTPSTEHGVNNFSTRGVPSGVMDRAASPRAATSTVYRVFWNSHNPTAATGFPNAQRFRGFLQVFNNASLFGPSTGGDAITIESFTINKIDNLP